MLLLSLAQMSVLKAMLNSGQLRSDHGQKIQMSDHEEKA